MANNYGPVNINWDKLSHLFDETKSEADERTDSMWHAAVRRARTSLQHNPANAPWLSQRTFSLDSRTAK